MAERPKEVFFDTLCPDCQPKESTEEAPRSENKLLLGHEEAGIVQPNVFPIQAPVHSPNLASVPAQSKALKTQKQKKNNFKQARKETPGREPIGSPIVDAAETWEKYEDIPAPILDKVGSPVVEGAEIKEVEKNSPAPGQIESSSVEEAKPEVENEGRSSTDSDWVKVPENHDEPWVFIDGPSSEEELLTTTGWPKQNPSGIKAWLRWK